jgi:hypothetical protein
MYILDRRSIETLYTSFVRPTIEYASEVWDNCNQEEKQSLENIQIEASRIATGAKRGTSHAFLYNETKWEPLQERRNRQKLNMMYKIVNGKAPDSLTQLIPDRTDQRTEYNLRTPENITTPHTRTDSLRNSFIPSTIRAWNALPNETRNAESLESFKKKIKPPANEKTKERFYTGNRKLQILHTRIRALNSDLKADLFAINLSEDPLCTCGDNIEDRSHYLMQCGEHTDARNKLRRKCTDLGINDITTETLLYGDNNFDEKTNIKLMKAVQNFIKDSKRF